METIMKEIPHNVVVKVPNSGTVAVIVLVWTTIDPLIIELATILKLPDVAVGGILNCIAKFPFESD